MKKAKVENLDLAVVKKDINKIAHSLVPILRELQRQCDGKAGEYIHLGATTQDIIDIGFVLAAKKAFDVIYDDLYEIEGIVIDLAEKYKNTIMTGRTHTQHALPITFGSGNLLCRISITALLISLMVGLVIPINSSWLVIAP